MVTTGFFDITGRRTAVAVVSIVDVFQLIVATVLVGVDADKPPIAAK